MTLESRFSVLASYVDDISNSMDEFSKGNFAVELTGRMAGRL